MLANSLDESGTFRGEKKAREYSRFLERIVNRIIHSRAFLTL
jgi:hypothetical protein